MMIQSIELENYRQYRGKVTVDLSCDSKKNINVIEGVNGAGKTNMLNAITWCLYGDEEHLSRYAGKKQPIINDAVLKELEKGEKIRAKVTLKMVSSKGRLHVFERQIYAKKINGGILGWDDAAEFHVFMQIGKDINEISEKEFLVNRILPKAVRNFFFFDGERLDEFFKEEKSETVRDAILDVSQLSLLDKAIDHLEKTVSLIRGDIRGGVEVEKISEAIEELEKGRDYCREEKVKNDERLKRIRREMSKIDEKLKTCSEPLAKELQKQREQIRKRLDELDKNFENTRELAEKNVTTIGPSIYTLKAIEKALGRVALKARKGEIPPKIKDTFIKELLEKGECICGTDISDSCKERRRVASLLKEARISEIYEEVTDLKYELSDVQKKALNFIDLQGDIRKKIADLEQQLESMKRNLREISTRLEGINVEEVSNLEITRGKLEQNEHDLIGEIKLLEEKIKNAQIRIGEFQRKLTKELAKSVRFRLAQEKLKLGEKTLGLFRGIKQKLIDDIRNTIQQRTKDYFLGLIWKKETYDNVKIDDDYNISVINRLGSECLGTLSAGERQVLALSFLAALREVSGFDAPVVIDTPLGRISKEPKENIAQLLPEFLKETQVTMFMTDEEYTPKVRKKLETKIGKEYRLDYNELESQTLVKPYGDK